MDGRTKDFNNEPGLPGESRRRGGGRTCSSLKTKKENFGELVLPPSKRKGCRHPVELETMSKIEVPDRKETDGEIVMTEINRSQTSQLPAKPDPALKHLDAFVGQWKTVGEIKASPYGPAGKITGTDNYEWLPGGFFLIHRVDVRMGDQKNESIEIIGYDAASGTYPMHSFDSQGNHIVMQAGVVGDTWTFTGETMRFTGAFSDDGKSISGKWEYLGNNSRWHPWMEVRLIKGK